MDDLLRAKGILRYGLFAVTTKGKALPDGSESASGLVVDSSGDVHSFWLDWSDEKRKVVFSDWTSVDPAPDWEEDEEYREARKAAGLA